MLKLYQFENCAYCEKVRKKLKELNLQYEKIEVDYDYSKRPELVIKYNNGFVPVLDDNGKIITQSENIIQYLQKNYSKV